MGYAHGAALGCSGIGGKMNEVNIIHLIVNNIIDGIDFLQIERNHTPGLKWVWPVAEYDRAFWLSRSYTVILGMKNMAVSVVVYDEN